jgi:glycosyltransferase involved in cell wall biosynthesis
VRIAFLGCGMTGYLDAQYRQLHRTGHELMVVHSAEEALSDKWAVAFGDLGVDDYAVSVAWDTPPKPASLKADVLDFKPDAVVMTSWNFTPAYRAVMKALPSEVVRILRMDNLWRAAPKQWLARATHRWYIRTVADAALVPSERTEFYARRLGFDAADIIRGSLSADLDMFASPRRTADELGSRRSFVYAGRLVEHKGADLLAQAYRLYRESSDEPWDLHVVGIGPLEPLLRGMDGVTMHGFLPPADVAGIMGRASAYVLPSRIEPYGVVVHEAVASGLPILCTDFAGAAAGFVQDGANGWIVPAGDAATWADAMARMSALSGSRLAEMSDVSRALSTRISPAIWAQNLVDEIERRQAAGGGRLSERVRRR